MFVLQFHDNTRKPYKPQILSLSSDRFSIFQLYLKVPIKTEPNNKILQNNIPEVYIGTC